ncbi:MAG TPA: hypothetical protein VF210_15675 [Pseudomonadales bacterium]
MQTGSRTSVNETLRRRALLIGLLLASAGCAAAPAPSSLDARLNDQARRLTMHCYWQLEGERMVLGGMYVYQACRDWARDVVHPAGPTR